MFNFSKIIALFSCLTIFSGIVHSIEIKDLYKAAVPLEDQNKSTRKEAFKDALKSVLVKVTGAEKVVTEQVLINQFNPYESYVLSYSYIENPEYSEYLELLEKSKQAVSAETTSTASITEDLAPTQSKIISSESALIIDVSENTDVIDRERTIDSSSAIESELLTLSESQIPKPYLLSVEFSRPAINKILRQSGQRVWGQSRPSLIVWMISEEQGIRSVLNEYESEAVIPDLLQNAKQRGLHVFFPVADLEDQINTDVNLLWGMFEEGLPQKTGRYNYDVALMVVIDSVKNEPGITSTDSLVDSAFETPGALDRSLLDIDSTKQLVEGSEGKVGEVTPLVSLRWKLVSSIQKLEALTLEQQIIDLPPEEALNVMLIDTANVLAEKYAVSESAESKVGHKLLVSAIDGFKSFIDVQTYLTSLPPVKNIKIEKVYADQMEFNVELYEGIDKLQQYIALGGRLSLLAIETSPDGIATEDYIHYIWQVKN